MQEQNWILSEAIRRLEAGIAEQDIEAARSDAVEERVMALYLKAVREAFGAEADVEVYLIELENGGYTVEISLTSEEFTYTVEWSRDTSREAFLKSIEERVLKSHLMNVGLARQEPASGITLEEIAKHYKRPSRT